MKAKKLIKHLGDALGSVRQLADVGGAVSLARGYDPFGNASWNAGSAQTPYGFTAEQTDANGLVYLRARYYAPGTGMFVSKDLWEGDTKNPMSFNPWIYVDANPVMYTDPSGLCVYGESECVKKVMRLYQDYGWQVDSRTFPEEELSTILIAAKSIESMFDKYYGGNGQARMRAAMSPAHITYANPVWYFINNHHVEGNTAYMIPNFSLDLMVHEMGHILDDHNNPLASITGGGPSDDMVGSLGLDPTLCILRFYCPETIIYDDFGIEHRLGYKGQIEERNTEKPVDTGEGDYGFTGPSEDFAVTFSYLVNKESILRSKAPQRMTWFVDHIKNLNATHPPYEGPLTDWVWFLQNYSPETGCWTPFN